MPIFRNHVLLLDHQDPTDQPLVGPVFRVRPSDGDPTGDHDQAWRWFVDLRREGPGGVAAELWTSFDEVAWSRVGRVPAAKTATVVEFADLPAFGPFLQIRTTVHAVQPPTTTADPATPTTADPTSATPAVTPTAPTPAPAPPKHTVTVRLVSDGPFTVVPA